MEKMVAFFLQKTMEFGAHMNLEAYELDYVLNSEF